MATALTIRPRLREQLGSGQRSFSFEFFPPKDDTGERRLWTAIRELEPLDPTFVSVTYGAGGSTRARTVRITARLRERASPRLTRRAIRPDPSPNRSEVSWCVVAYQGAGTAILADMRVRPSVGKVSLGLVAVVAGLGCCVLVGALALELLAADVRPRAVLAAWSAGITAVVLTILALQEHGDPDDDPRYFATLVHGLRQEWHR